MSPVELEIYLDEADVAEQLRADARAGLNAAAKWLPPRWFYDARGSQLFEEITRLPEYYPTRAEREILRASAREIAEDTDARTLVELGSGSSDKTRLLLDALGEHGRLASFIPLDVSAAALGEAVAGLRADYPGLDIHGVVADFGQHLKRLPTAPARLVAFLGGTIGNLTRSERARFLTDLRGVLEPGEWLLLGADLVKDPAVLVPAYDDSAGVTAAFNRNVLSVLNRELGADFQPEAFAHLAVWNPEQEWIEMRLRATRAMVVRIPGLDLTVSFAEGEELRTEVSAKFRREGLAAELVGAGFAPHRWFTDPAGQFSLSLARVVDRSAVAT